MALVAALATVVATPFARADVAVNPKFTNLTKGEDPEETYELNALNLTTIKTISWYFVAGPPPDGWEPSLGKYRKKLGGDEFLGLLGRDDLVRAARARRMIGIGFFVVGGAAVVTGIYLGMNRGWGGLSYGLAGGGALAIGLGFAGVSSESSMTASEAYEACYRYDDALRAHLGLPPIPVGPTPPHARAQKFGRRLLSGFRFGAAPMGAAASLSFSF